ncbi:MAG: hypothetical protein IKK03_08640 [Lachnospiraceae bacterium]|nr:hypothetical protein [Lachnospiraceae bacterium]MBR4059890.1 hypothetical protein [Lachnospiraceae bacterium]
MKKKWLSRATATVLVSIMTAGMLVGCGDENVVSSETETQATSETQVASETPVADEGWSYPVDTDEKLSFYIVGNLSKSAKYADRKDVPFYQGLIERTGIPIEWRTAVEGADANAAYNLLLQEEVLPSIMFNAYTISTVNTLYEDGLIYDLTPYLEEYAPDFWAYMNDPANIADKNAITNEEGKFLMFPLIRENDTLITYIGPVIRQDWLDECGLKAPVTLEDWETVLTAFKEKYNATFSFRVRRYNYGGFASGVDAFADLDMQLYVDNGEVKLANAQPEWKEYLTVLNRWYDAGLIDPDFATNDDAAVRTKALNNQTGAIVTAMSQLTNYIADAEAENTGAVWVGCSYPRTAAGAPTKRIQTESTLVKATNGAVVTTSCTEEELIAAIQFLNYGYSEEGMMYWNFGEEGKTYEVAADGSIQFTDVITADEKGISEALKDYTGMYSVGIGIQMEAFQKAKNAQSSVEALAAWTDNTVARDYMTPPYSRTEEEQTKYTDIKAVLSTYVSEMALKFVTGEESLDNFDKFVEQLNAYKLPELLEIEQAAYDRYVNR